MFPGFTVRTTYRLHFGDEQSGGATRESQQDAFGEQLADQALPSGAQGGTDRDLFLAGGGARKQQVRNVGAGDQQDQGHRAEQHQNGALHVPDDLFQQRHDADREGPVALVLLADAAGDHRDIGLGLLHGDARLEAGHHVIVLVAAAVHGIGAPRQGKKNVHLAEASDGRHHFVIEQELRPSTPATSNWSLSCARAVAG